jgi:hypothetical protein
MPLDSGSVPAGEPGVDDPADFEADGLMLAVSLDYVSLEYQVQRHL